MSRVDDSDEKSFGEQRKYTYLTRYLHNTHNE